MRVLLLSAYAAPSHVYWQRGLYAMCPEWEWQLLSLPARHFGWRVRGNPLYWSLAQREVLEQPYDLLVATSMVDLATLRGLVPGLARIPSILYFHENQFAYPQQAGQRELLEVQMVSLYSSLAADRCLFNSSYNRDTFLAGCEALLNKLPDKVPTGIVDRLAQRSEVVPVPLLLTPRDQLQPWWPGTPGVYPLRPLRLVWPARFEYDKGPALLLAVLRQLETAGVKYELALVGQQFRRSPGEFATIESEFSHRLVQFGYLKETLDYQQLLLASDIVLSTAAHEFQGIAVMEAAALDCVPVVPGRLAYPEFYPQQNCYPDCAGDIAAQARAATTLIIRLASQLPAPGSGALVEQYRATALAPRYRQVFGALNSGQQ